MSVESSSRRYLLEDSPPRNRLPFPPDAGISRLGIAWGQCGVELIQEPGPEPSRKRPLVHFANYP